MRKSWKKITLLLLALSPLLISGCTTTQKLKRPIPEGNRIGVIANFRDVALFQRAGTTSVDNTSFYRRIPGLRMSTLVTATVVSDISRSRKFRAIPIYARTANELFSTKVIEKGFLTPQYRDYVAPLIGRKNLDTILLVTPGDIDFGDGQYTGAIWWTTGYGLFNRAFIFMQTNTVFAAYDVYLIDAKNYRVLAKSRGDFQARTHDIDIAWRKGYAGVSAETLKTINNVIRKEMPPTLIRAVHKTGLP